MRILILQHIKIEDPGYIKDLMIKDGAELTTIELDSVRHKLGCTPPIYSDSLRFHKVHDMYKTPYSNGKPIVSNKCSGAIYLVRNPLDIVISLKHFFDYDNICRFLLD